FEYLDQCCGKWEKLPPEKRTREQQAVIDVNWTLGGVEGDGILEVWAELGDSMDRIIESFRMAGASEIAQLVESSSFCKGILARAPAGAKEWQCTAEEEKKLRDIDLRISFSNLGPDAREGLLKFLPKRKA